MNLSNIYQDLFVDDTNANTQLDYVDTDAASAQADVEVGDGTNFEAGQQVIIYDGQGTFETATIDSISTDTLTMTTNLSNTYPEGSYIGKYLGFIDTVSSKFTRLYAPDLGDGSDGAYVSSGDETWSTEKNYTSVTIQNGDTITVDGFFAIRCQGDFHIEAGGVLSAKGQGHDGGGDGGFTAQQGDSELGAGSTSPANNGGGGGGGTSNPGAGGGAGYATNGQDGSGSNNGDKGLAYNDEQLSTFTEAYMKGSGGGGASRSSSGSSPGNLDGGNGGGVIMIHTKNILVEGEIDCDGEDGKGDGTSGYTGGTQYGGSGAGAGGTVFIQALNTCIIGSGLVHVDGGNGGNGWSGGNGGDGGDGRIRIECFGKVTGSTTPSYATGYNNDTGGFTEYGWYHTEQVNTLNDIITANAYVKQENVLRSNLDSAASSGQDEISVSDTLENTSSLGNTTSTTSQPITGSYSWQSFLTPVKGYDSLRVYEFDVEIATAGSGDVDWKITDEADTTILASGTLPVLVGGGGPTVYTLTLPTELELEGSTVYKLQLFRSGATTTEWAVSSADPYPDGESSVGAGYDFYFTIKYKEYTGEIVKYQVGDDLVIYEDDKMEIVQIDGIAGGTITLSDDLIYSYTTSAEIFVQNHYAYVSIEPVGDNENQVAMDLQEVSNDGDDFWYFTWSKTIQIDNVPGNGEPGVRLVGKVRLQGKENDSVDINITEASWSFY